MGTKLPKTTEELPAYAKIGIGRHGAGCRIIPGTGETTSKIILDSPEGAVRFDLARYWAGQTFDHLANDYFNRLDEAMAKPWALSKNDVLRYLAPVKLDVRIDGQKELDLQEEARRAQAFYSRWIPSINVTLDGEGEALNWTFSAGTIDDADIADSMRILRELGWKVKQVDPDANERNSLYHFAAEGVSEVATKRDAILGWTVGLTKTRASLVIAEIHRVRGNIPRTVIIAMRQNLSPWDDEFKKMDPIIQRYGADCATWWLDKKDKPDFSKPFLLVSFERMQHMTPEEVKKFTAICSESVIICDEIYNLQRKTTKRFKNIMAMAQGKHHLGLSGTLLRGFSHQALPPLIWTMRGGSAALPDYRYDRQGSEKAFNDRFGMTARANDGTTKKVAVLNNEKEFSQMLRPLMHRVLRHEPRIIAEIGSAPTIKELVNITMDAEHEKFYGVLLDQFSLWYKRILIERGQPEKFGHVELMTKMTFQDVGLTTPWNMPVSKTDTEFVAPVFPRRPTAFHEWTINRVREAVGEGRQAICFSKKPDALNVCHEFMTDIPSGVIHGEIKQKDRQRAIEAFRAGDAPVLWISLEVGAAALNLPQSSVCVIMDPDWTPSKMDQAEGRQTRGAVSESPYAYRLTCAGTLYEYMHGGGMVKQRAMDAALDGIAQRTTGADILDIRAYAYGLVFPGSLAFNSDEYGRPRTYTLPTDTQKGRVA